MRLIRTKSSKVAHRVLRMVNRGSAEASRDFVALFLVDPARPLTPATSVLSQPYMLTRTLSPPLMPLLQVDLSTLIPESRMQAKTRASEREREIERMATGNS